MHIRYPMQETSRKLRRSPTPEEEILWKYIRKRQVSGKKFLRQHPIIVYQNSEFIHYYIPDFYCSEIKIAVELDGPVHDRQIERDQDRDKSLQELGIQILRFKNHEINDIHKILTRIKEAIENTPNRKQMSK